MSNHGPDRYRDRHALPPSIWERAHMVMSGEAGPSVGRFDHLNGQLRMTVDSFVVGSESPLEYAVGGADSVSPGGNALDTYFEDVELPQTRSSKGEGEMVPISRDVRSRLFRSTELGPADDVHIHDAAAAPQQQEEQAGRAKRHFSRLSTAVSDSFKRRIPFWYRHASRDSGYRSGEESGANGNSAAVALYETTPSSRRPEDGDGGALEPLHTIVTVQETDQNDAIVGEQVANQGVPLKSHAGAQYSQTVAQLISEAHQHGSFDPQHLEKRLSVAPGNTTSPEMQSRASQALKLENETKARLAEFEFNQIYHARQESAGNAAGRRHWSLSNRLRDDSMSHIERLAQRARTESAPIVSKRSLLFFKKRSGTVG